MINPKHILITGASSGIGAALAHRYAGPGVKLALHGRNSEKLARVTESVRALGSSVTSLTGDVTDAMALKAWIFALYEECPLDLVIANAGISLGSSALYDTPSQSKPIMAINLEGLLNTIQPCLPLMAKRGQGQLALMSSLASFRGFAGAASYCSSKAAIRVYGEALRGEMAPLGVAVSVICPGYIKTPLTDKNLFHMPLIMAPEKAARIIQKGLAANKPRIAFPWPMVALVRLASLLPQDLLNRIMWKLPKKGD